MSASTLLALRFVLPRVNTLCYSAVVMDAILKLEQQYRKPALPQVQSGDTVRVHQLIREGAKQRTQIFEGVIIRTHRLNEVSACVTVRRIASGVGVEKTFLLHSPNISKLEIIRRAKVRRNFLSYLRARRGKSARLKEVAFDKVAANDVTPKGVNAMPEDTLDADLTELNADTYQDALDDTISLTEATKLENRQASADDEAPANGDIDQADISRGELSFGHTLCSRAAVRCRLRDEQRSGCCAAVSITKCISGASHHGPILLR